MLRCWFLTLFQLTSLYYPPIILLLITDLSWGFQFSRILSWIYDAIFQCILRSYLYNQCVVEPLTPLVIPYPGVPTFPLLGVPNIYHILVILTWPHYFCLYFGTSLCLDKKIQIFDTNSATLYYHLRYSGNSLLNIGVLLMHNINIF